MGHPIKLSLEGLKHWQENDLEHIRYEYDDIKPDDFVIDIGAYEGEFTQKIRAKYDCHVIAFEPTGAFVHTKANDPKVSLVRAMADTSEGNRTMGGEHFWYSIFEPGGTIFPCVDIYMALLRIERIALLKMNIEGMEITLLPYMIEKGMMPKIENIQVQFHYIEGRDSESEYAAIAAQLSKTHELAWRHPFVWESWKLKK